MKKFVELTFMEESGEWRCHAWAEGFLAGHGRGISRVEAARAARAECRITKRLVAEWQATSLNGEVSNG